MYIRRNIRLYPTRTQKDFLNQNIGNQRFVWNYIVSASKQRYEQEKKFIFFHEAASMLLELKKQHEWLKTGNSQSLQQTFRDYEKSLKQAIKNKKGFPKFKKKRNGGSFRMPQSCKAENNRLNIPKLKGGIKFKGQAPEQFKSVTISKNPSGQYHASFVVEIPDVEKVEITEDSSAVGIDLNSNYLAVLSSGEAIKNPKHLLKKERYLKRQQRKLKHKTKSSNNWKKHCYRIARIHQKVADQRKNHINQVTTQIVKTHDVVVIEDLNVRAMQKFNGRMIQHANFGYFRSNITWKTNKFGKHLVVIDRFMPTSKVCSSCGQIHKLTLKQRQLQCNCGLTIHRDFNAALNIHRAGTARINACRDTKPLNEVSNNLVWVSLKQEITTFRSW